MSEGQGVALYSSDKAIPLSEQISFLILGQDEQ